MSKKTTYTAFAGQRRIVTDELGVMLAQTKAYIDVGEAEPILIFDDRTGRQIDFDFRGSIEDVLDRLASHPLAGTFEGQKGPGRPRLGVVSKEITLLPRHWEWLGQQSGGISAALRRMVEREMKHKPDDQAVRKAVEAAHNFMSAMAGDLPGYEEASRALFAHDGARLEALIRMWPQDIREHVTRMLSGALAV